MKRDEINGGRIIYDKYKKNDVPPSFKIKSRRKRAIKKYGLYDLRDKYIGEFTKEGLMTELCCEWQTILPCINKDKTVKRLYKVKSA